MRIEYAEPTVVDRIEAAIAQARLEDQRIKCIRLTRDELEEFCQVSGMIFNITSAYTYKHHRVAWDSGQ